MRKIYEFVELSLLVSVRINSEQVPEDVIEFSLGSLVQNFNDEASEIGIVQVSLASRVIFIEVDLQFAPDSLDEAPFFIINACWWLVISWLFFLLGFGFDLWLDAHSEVFPDEIDILSEGDETVFVSIEEREDFSEIFLGGFSLQEGASIENELDEFVEADLPALPLVRLNIPVFPVKDDRNEVDFKQNLDQLFESQALILSVGKVEVSGQDKTGFFLVQAEDVSQDGLDFVLFELLVMVEVITHEDFLELIEEKSDESIKGGELEQFLVPFLIGVDNWLWDRIWNDNLNLATQRTEVVLQEEEVNFVGDPAFFAEIDFLEEQGNLLRGSTESNVAKGIIQSDSELFLIHNSLFSSRIALLPMKPLNGHFSEVLLNAEVGQLIISDVFIAVDVIPEHISGHVFELVFIFFKELDQSCVDLFLVEFEIFVLIKWDQEFSDSLSDQAGQIVVRESEPDDPVSHGSQFLFLRIGEDHERGLSFEDVSTSNGFIVLFQIVFLASVDANSQEFFNPLQILVKSDVAVFILINKAEDEEKDALSDSPEVQELESIAQKNNEFFSTQIPLARRMVPLESTETELSNQIDEHNGERHKLDSLIKLEEAVKNKSDFHLTEIAQNVSDQGSQILVVNG